MKKHLHKKIPTLLVVEDDLLLLKAYGIKFKQEGWNTVLLSDGASAMAYLNEIPPDAILCDLSLPGTSGFQILQAMRKNNTWKDVPVFILTNSDTPEDRARAGGLGAIEYLVKVDNGIDAVVEKVKKSYAHETSRNQ